MNSINRNIKHKQAFAIWLAIYPLITLLYYFLGEFLGSLPLALRTLIITLIAVPIMVYGLVPLINKLLSGWLY